MESKFKTQIIYRLGEKKSEKAQKFEFPNGPKTNGSSAIF